MYGKLCVLLLYVSADVNLRDKLHGPAVTVEISNKQLEKVGVPSVSIDMAPAILTCSPMSIFGWPSRSHNITGWPSPEVINDVTKRGYDLVAKHNFFWTASFAVCEKMVSRHADQKDGGCRKKVHKIMKKKFATTWKTGKAVSQYVIKVRLICRSSVFFCFLFTFG